MKKVFAIADSIVSPLGYGSESNWNSLLLNKTGIALQNHDDITLKNFYAALFNESQLKNIEKDIKPINYFTKLEKLFIASIASANIENVADLASPKTLFLFSSTKGNIDILENENAADFNINRAKLPAMAKEIVKYFNNPNEPVIVSNACISGVLALMAASFYIRQGTYENVVVTGGDIISSFTVSGFQSLYALGKSFCRPFDKERDGINLGESTATIILSAKKNKMDDIELLAASTSNDANHISGPSKTGDGLANSIYQTFKNAKISAGEIDFVSSHGTATIYNDEMEAKAFHLSALSDVPVHSLKGFFGHTLGAAGILESIISMWSIKKQTLILSKGYYESGVSIPLNIIKENKKASINNCLKTASGFGGCNASIIFSNNG